MTNRRHTVATMAALAMLSACSAAPATPQGAATTASPLPTGTATPGPSTTVAAGIPGTILYGLGFHQTDWTFWRLGSDGKTTVIASGANNEEPEISPDGTRLAWIDHATGQLMVSNVDGSARKVVDTAKVYAARWSPDSNWLVGERDVTRTSSTVHLVKADGTVKRDLGQGFHPVWSADGAWVVYVDSQGDRKKLTRVRPDGTDRKTTTVKLNARHVYQAVSASPGAEQVLVQAVSDEGDPGAPGHFFGNTIIDTASGEPKDLASAQGDAVFALWTADGRMLLRVMTSKRSGSVPEKYALELRAKDGTVLARQIEPFDNGAYLTTYTG
jgi:Tol biopolymer transport system component